MTQTVQTLEGWYALHDFRTLNINCSSISSEQKGALRTELSSTFNKWSEIDEKRAGSFGLYRILGSKSDFLFLNLRPTVEDLIDTEHELNSSIPKALLTPAYSYVSLVELSNYVVNRDAENSEHSAEIKARLYPKLPNSKNICFYPMNKKRDGENNWYLLPIEERKRLMKSHGLIGRKFAGKLTQMIGGSTGLDDWEWGVTLFSDDPAQFKKVIYDMRFDELSAKYGEFGSFQIGSKVSNQEAIDTIFGNQIP